MKNTWFARKGSLRFYQLLISGLVASIAVNTTLTASAQTSLETSLRSYFCNPANTNNENWCNASTAQMWDRIGGESAQFINGVNSGDRWQADMPADVYNVYKSLSTIIFGQERYVNSGYAYDQSYFDWYKAKYGVGKWHAGLDIAAPSGTSVRSATSGTTTMIQNASGNYFIGVKADDGKLWIYGHLSSYSVALNTRVNAGQLIGYTNGSNHLHLEVQNTHTYQPTYGAHVDRGWLLQVTISPLEAYAQRLTSTSPSPLAFVNGSSRPYIDANFINLTVSASNLAGKQVYVQMWRPAVGSNPAREWNYSRVAPSTSITFQDLDGIGGTFAGVDYYTVASLNPIPPGTAALRRTACYTATGGQQLCDRVRR